jgi:hypothetical protein
MQRIVAVPRKEADRDFLRAKAACLVMPSASPIAVQLCPDCASSARRASTPSSKPAQH